MAGDSDLNRREGYVFQPLNRTVYDSLVHNNNSGTPAPKSKQPEMDNGNSTSVPLTEFDVEHAAPKGTKYGAISGDDSSSITESEPKSPTPSINWLPNQRRRANERFRYTAYYLPFLSWMPQYRWESFQGDAIAALTVGSLYIPMCFSFAILGRVNPISGLYAFIFHPLIYALLGTCPQMVVGPEATGSLLVGSLVDQLRTGVEDEDPNLSSQISGVATLIAGAMLLSAGLGRVGFIDSILNRPFMQGFISGVGFVLIVEQAIPELGLYDLAKEDGVAHSSAVVKLGFLLTHLSHTHILTAMMAMSSLGFILTCR